MIDKIISHYKIIEKLGSGGMGVVYKALDVRLDRFIALKFLPTHLGTDKEEQKRFIYEAEAASALEHNNICNIHEIDETEDEQLFIAMAYYEGETLKKKIEQGPIPVKMVIDLASQIAGGLIKAHQKGIVHRDIKPANVMVTHDGVVKILDFGIAKMSKVSDMTKIGSTIGTIAYMSPEQATGGEVDPRTDIWSLGVVMYEMITGRLPFMGVYEQAIIYSILNDAPVQITELDTKISKKLEQIVIKALSKNPVDRYENMSDMLADLRSIYADRSSGVSNVSNVIISAVRKLSYKTVIPIFITVLIVTIYMFFSSGEKDPETFRGKSIAVLPFDNLTGDEKFDMWGRGIPELLITALSGSDELYVIDNQTIIDVVESLGRLNDDQDMNFLSIDIASKVNVESIILGNILKAGDKLRIQLKLRDAISGEILRSEIVDGETQDDFFQMVKVLSNRVKNYLEIKILEQDLDYDLKEVFTNSADAYQYYRRGVHSFIKLDFRQATQSFEKAIEIDPNFVIVYFWLTSSNYNLGEIKLAKKYFNKADKQKDKLTYFYQLRLERLKAVFEKKPYEQIKSLKKLLEVDPQYRFAWYALGDAYISVGQYEKAIGPLEKAIELSDQWGSDWKWSPVYELLGIAYHTLGKHDLELEIYQKGLSVLPNNPEIINWLAMEYISRGEITSADVYLVKYRAIRTESGWTQPQIMYDIGSIFYKAGDFENAENILRRVVELDPKNGDGYNLLAKLLISNNINVDEGMDYVDRALKIDPDNPGFLYTKGIGHLRKREFDLANRVLEKAEKKSPTYNHRIHRLIKDAKRRNR